MVISELHLQNFRSYSKKTFHFSPTTTILLGPNTAGKTNVLEAVFLLGTGKSFRADSDREMIRWGNEIARIQVKIETKNYSSSEVEKFNEDRSNDSELEIVLTSGQVMERKTPIKRYFVNGVSRRAIDFLGNVKVVLFWPEDLELITNSPSLRRRYLDFVLVQVDREYRRSLFSYEKGVRQRNRLLEKIREGEASRSQLLFWDQLLIKTGNYITNARESFITAINGSEKPFGQFSITYDMSTISEARLVQYAEVEVGAATTLVGPHRDDIQFSEKERDLSKFGSRGEQRLAVLWLKLAELEFVTARMGERPILLLDDIFSELDHTHREEVLKVVGKQQTILTTADQHFLPVGLVRNAEMIELK